MFFYALFRDLTEFDEVTVVLTGLLNLLYGNSIKNEKPPNEFNVNITWRLGHLRRRRPVAFRPLLTEGLALSR